MVFLTRYWTQIRVQLGQMSANTKWLIGALAVIVLLAGYLVMLLVAEPEYVPVTSFAGDRQAEVVAMLQQRGIDVRADNGQILVPYSQHLDAIAAIEAGGMMAADTSKAFDDMILTASPWDTSAKTSMAFLQAKQKFLGQVVAKMKGVRAADVVISMPQQNGFGRTFVKPSASVNVVMQGGAGMNRDLVDAIASLVGGAVAEMSPMDVVVIDAAGGKAHRVSDPEELSSDQQMAHMLQLESHVRQKISDLLRYIPNVIVAVAVRTDATQRAEIDKYTYNESPAVKKERSKTSETTDARSGGEAGARSNTGADIVAGAKTGGSSKTEEIETEFDTLPLTQRERIKKIGQTQQEVNVTVNVPRTYFVGLFNHGKPADAPEPDDASLQQLVDLHLAEIKKQVEPLIRSEVAPGSVTVHMIRDMSAVLAMQSGAANGAIGTFVSGPWMQPAVLGVLGLFSIGLVFHLMRKSSKVAAMPTAEELAGIPPRITTEELLIGEAGEHEQAMMGLELAEEEMHSRKVAQQIDELVSEHPQEAATLFKRWVRAEE
ncbi:MAG: hypothetical protein WD768_03150 [Phycisphaeraceae bacterium]